ncbi:Alanine racemase [Desulfonema limicola]|uniref:Alanine racemase n=1 Tax=Desulfonema limicola TaxID=45656 RepID=A0A975GH93_9BACT|nr:alanine racemase [Desulfonema limicola]QTA81165.1 Alanine racemase [Desulfonema limicola]
MNLDMQNKLPSKNIWSEINLGAIAHNINELRSLLDPKVKMLTAVKANAYGHGMTAVAETALKCGADMLGVARYDEGIDLRRAGITAPVLVFGYTSPDAAEDIIKYKLTPTIFSFETARRFASAAQKSGKKIKIHIKIDTGMGRIGIIQVPAPDNEIKQIVRLSGLEPEGIYTHFACADSRDKNHAGIQFKRFTDLLDRLSASGIEFPIRHAANSAALIDMPETHLDMVRPGIALYGLYPSHEVDCSQVNLKPAMTLKAKIGQIKEVPAGFTVSYGSTYTTTCPGRIATIPAGYADGFRRSLSSRGSMLVCGQRAPVIGRVCMDMTMLDISHIENARPESEVVIIGRQGSEVITADEMANMLDTINYEVVSCIMSRVPRFYV